MGKQSVLRMEQVFNLTCFQCQFLYFRALETLAFDLLFIYDSSTPYFWIRTPSGCHQLCHRTTQQPDLKLNFSNGKTVLLRFRIFLKPLELFWGMLKSPETRLSRIILNPSYPNRSHICLIMAALYHSCIPFKFNPHSIWLA